MMRYVAVFIWIFNSLETFGTMNDKVLHVDEEHFKETLPIQNGARLYHLQGLKPLTWYEVKMSYPASVCASFLYVVPFKIRWQHLLIRLKG